MRVTELSIENYRSIGELDVSFDPRITVLIGKNGIGKSSILDALATLLESLRTFWPNSNGARGIVQKKISKEQIRYGESDSKIAVEFEFEKKVPNCPTNLEIRYSDNTRQYDLNPSLMKIWNFSSNLKEEIDEQPLFVYYRQDRGFDAKTKQKDVLDRDSLLAASLFGDLKAISDLEAWWDKRDAEEARQVRDSNSSYRDPQLEAIRNLIREIDNFTGISFKSTAEKPGLYLSKTDNASVHISNLSTGERSYIILLADLARRLQVMSPEKSIWDIPGIVLIDEIELNLHPSWQSNIIPNLLKIFKKCQFVATTHSPQVISAVSSDSVRVLKADMDDKLLASKPLNTKGRTSDYLLEGVFESHERYPAADRLIDDFNRAVDQGDETGAKQIMERISESIEGDPPELIVLRKRLKRLEGRP